MNKPVSHTSRNKLKRLLAPKYVAVMGGKEAGRVIQQCERLGFEGEIWPVNPNREELEGRKCYASLADLPTVPDAAFIAIPREHTIEAVRMLSAMGAGGAVCYASGFAELGEEGARFQEDLLAAAGQMPIIGPNCYGVLNALDRVALWPDNHGLTPLDSGAAIITQSGNMGINFTMSCRGVPVAALMSLGNQAAVTVNDCIEALLDDERIKVIGLHVEGIDDVARFSSVALLAWEKRVPIVMFKTGRSEKGAQATVSHTSTLAGSDALYDTLLARYGIARLNSITAFLESLKLLSVFGPLEGNTIASLSCSGGEASMMADQADGTGLVFADLKPETATKLSNALNEYVDITNPLDYHTFIWGDREGTEATFDAMLSGGFDVTMLLLDFPTNDGARMDDWDMTLDVFATRAAANNAHGAILATLPESMPANTAQSLMARGVAPLVGVDDALSAIAAAAKIGTAYRNRPPSPLKPAGPGPAKPATLDEWRSKELLRQAGLPVPDGVCVPAKDAATAARKLGYPVVIKAVGSDLAHKSDVGAVRLNLKSDREVKDAARDLARFSPDLLVEKMAKGSLVELIIGVARDDQFGPHLVLGAGGVMVELIKDSTTLLLPTSKADIRRALLSLKIAPLLEGFRGRAKADIGAAVDAAWKVAKFAQANWDTISELDINPLIVREKGQGAVVADALIRMQTEETK